MELKIFRNHVQAKLPSRNPGDNGFDLSVVEDSSFIGGFEERKFILKPGERKKFKTGLQIQLPTRHFALIRPRSGNAFRHGLHILGGLIDESYTGDWDVILLNTGKEDFIIKPGDRVAQFVIIKDDDYLAIEVASLEYFEKTTRADKGFGSSGY